MDTADLIRHLKILLLVTGSSRVAGLPVRSMWRLAAVLAEGQKALESPLTAHDASYRARLPLL